MNKQQGNKFRMYEAVSAVMAEYAESVRTVDALPSAVKQFNDVMNLIGSQDRRVREASIGKTAAKESAEQTLIVVLIKVSAALTSLAHRMGNQELLTQVKLNRSRLYRMRNVQLQATSKALLTIARGYQERLQQFGVDVALIEQLNAAIIAYDDAISKKEGGFAGRNSALQAIKELFRTNDLNLRNDLDRLMELFCTDQVDFYTSYRAARYIKNLGHRFKVAPKEEVKAS